jgi:hypothetical protein
MLKKTIKTLNKTMAPVFDDSLVGVVRCPNELEEAKEKEEDIRVVVFSPKIRRLSKSSNKEIT